MGAEGTPNPSEVFMPSINGETPLVRPYAISGGRTHGRRELGPDATVRAATAPTWHRGLPPELQAIILLCRTPVTPVEIAATLAIPLGVVDVLVEELSATGLLTVDRVETARSGGRHRTKEVTDAA
jgi:hypothetical protein